MTHETPREVSLRDPLSELTRKERRSLLVASTLGIIFVEGGMIPTKISSFGIEFSRTDQRSLLFVVGAIVLYQLFGFGIYASSDFIKWRFAYVTALRLGVEERKIQRREPVPQDDPDDEWSQFDRKLDQAVFDNWNESMKRNMPIFRLSGPVAIVRVLFEFLLPIVMGVLSIYLLWSGAQTLPGL